MEQDPARPAVLIPACGTIMAIIFLGERLAPCHLVDAVPAAGGLRTAAVRRARLAGRPGAREAACAAPCLARRLRQPRVSPRAQGGAHAVR